MTRITFGVEDVEDLAVVSARLQDAVTRVKDLAWLPKAHRFAALLNRFKWEDAEASRSSNLRVRSRLVFDRVLAVRSHRFRHTPDAVASLLAIRFTPRAEDDPQGTVELVFAGGGIIRLDVECLEATLSDVSGDWAALGRPAHEG